MREGWFRRRLDNRALVDGFCGEVLNVTLSLHGGQKHQIAGGRIALAAEDVFAACAELKRKGVCFETEPTDYSVCQAAVILDPEARFNKSEHDVSRRISNCSAGVE